MFRRFLFLLLMAACGSAFAQTAPAPPGCNSDRFGSVLSFPTDSIVVKTNVPYDTGTGYWTGTADTLRMDLYYPKKTADPLTYRPLVVLFFGGAFRVGKKESMKSLCMSFAQRGYVAATVQYRLGWDTLCQSPDTLTKQKAVYRAVQDAHASLRFLHKRFNTYGIDTNWVFAGGESAGAATVLTLVYMSQQEINQSNPAFSGLLGPLNRAGNRLRPKAVFNNWGGVDTSFFDAAEALPMIAFHGLNDQVVYPGYGPANDPCLVNQSVIMGSYQLHRKLIDLGICSDLSVTNGGHGIYDKNLADDLFRAGRAACFFKSIYCNNCDTFLSNQRIVADCDAEGSLQRRGTTSEEPIPVLYPNPARNALLLSYLNATPGSLLRVYDAVGRLRLERPCTQETDISMLPSGLYFLVIEGRPERFRFVKE